MHGLNLTMRLTVTVGEKTISFSATSNHAGKAPKKSNALGDSV